LISAIAFLIAAARWEVDSEGASKSVMRGYAPNTSRVGTKPPGPAELFIALKAI
jgi:hypothetical protein